MPKMSTRRKLAIATWSSPREGNIYGKLTLDATEALAFKAVFGDEKPILFGTKGNFGHSLGAIFACWSLVSAPTLFVGGSARGIHLRMVAAMGTAYRLNIICGLHEGTWSLVDARNRIVWAPGGVRPPALISEEEVPF